MKTWRGIESLALKLLLFVLLSGGGGCTVQQRIRQAAEKNLLSDSIIRKSHVGIAVYDPVAQKVVYSHNGQRYFIPASNTKIITCYAALKHLGDSIIGLRFAETDQAVYIRPTGDPTLLHRDYSKQPVMEWLKSNGKPLVIETSGWKATPWGAGWSWDDYDQDYMAERSLLPVYGNTLEWHQSEKAVPDEKIPGSPPAITIFSYPEVNWKVRFDRAGADTVFSVKRAMHENVFFIREGKEKNKTIDVPFKTNGVEAAIELLKDSLPQAMTAVEQATGKVLSYQPVVSRPLDAVLEPMMHRSDNFFAEQLLLMVSEQLLGTLDAGKAIDSLMRGDLAGLPQPPRWVDGSGLSRYNLFTPEDIVAMLDSIQRQFGIERIKHIFPTGGEGTLSTLYLTAKEKIYAKTGTLSGVIALSGYIYTQKKHWISFSIMINNHRGSTSVIRKKIEQFITSLQRKL